MQWPAMAILQAMSRHRILAISSLGNGIANLTLSLLLVRPYGLTGVAIGTLLPTAVEYFAIVLPYSLRATGIRTREAIAEIFLPALLPVIPTMLVLYALRIAVEPASILSIAAVAIVASCIYAITFLSIGGNRNERQWLKANIVAIYRLVTRYQSTANTAGTKGMDG
jgi:O-antigen/teichoic acid export membrane protein